MIADNNKMIAEQVRLWRERIKKTIDEALELAPDDKLDWMPAENMLSLGNVFLHIPETSDWWYDCVLLGKEAIELAFPGKKCPPKEQVKKHLDEHWARLERFFAEPPAILEKIHSREVDLEGRKWTFEGSGFWVFMHLLEHDIHHRCQINQYLRILGIKPPRV